MSRSIRWGSRAGFSLVEMLFSIAIGMLVAGGIVTLMVSQMQLSTTQNRNIINQEQMRDVVKFIVDELQLAGTTDGSEPVIAADNTTCSFYADIDDNGVTDRVDFYMSETTLMRRYTTDVGGNPFVADDPLLPNVYNISFTYYAPGDAAPANISEITSVEVRLQLDTSVETTSYTGGKLAPQALVGRATLRNKRLGGAP